MKKEKFGNVIFVREKFPAEAPKQTLRRTKNLIFQIQMKHRREREERVDGESKWTKFP